MKPLSAFRPVGALLWLWCMLALVGQAQTPERNYVLSRTYKQKGASEANGNTYAGNAYQVTTQVSYIDGLGQPTQQITAFAGPNGQDLLVRTEYDHQFRPVKVHSPLPIGSNTGRYVNSPDGLYYNDGNRFCQPTTNAYTESVYEPSPLNRPQEQKAPGVGTGVRTAYQVNAGFTIKKYVTTGTGLRDITQSGDYGNNTLTYTEIKDENDNTTQVFTDGYGRTVLRRVKIDNQDLDTYYVYNEAGQLRAVLQPMYQQEGNLDKFAFLYEYNARGLVVKKKVPGAGESTMSYDGRDRLTGLTDANGRAFYYRYDELNRQTEMGIGTEALLYTYYDNYGWGPLAGYDNELGLNANDHFAGSPQNDGRKGLVTGTKARVLNADGGYGDWLQTVTYYDDKGRVIQVHRQLYGLGGGAYERTSYKLSFDGKPLTERTTQGSSSKTYVLEKTFEYDQADRLVRTRHKFSENGTVKKDYVHAEQDYDATGRPAAKRLHGGMQGQSFKFHVRGWLCQVGNPAGPKLTLDLSYQNNGNVASLGYSTNARTGGMNFTYDRANRLTGATSNGSFQDHNESNLGYDRNGNLTSLNRSRPGATFDALQYFYDGNRLHRVNDNSGQGEGFNNGANQDNEFVYDNNGNLTKDFNRGLGDNNNQGIQYNVLNLVRYLNKGGQELRYTYDAAGVKRQLTAPQGSTFYAGAFEYKGDGTLLRIGLEEGQLVRNADGSFTVQYYLEDHLGNVRVVVDEGGNVVQETEYHAFGYAVSRTGADKNKYLYNGKEQQPETAFLDFGARQYDPTLGRWMNIDPLSEVARRWSPYTYVYNNPLRFIDPDGMLVNPSKAANTPDGQLPKGEDLVFDDGYGSQELGNSAVSKAALSGVYVTTGGGGGNGGTQASSSASNQGGNSESRSTTASSCCGGPIPSMYMVNSAFLTVLEFIKKNHIQLKMNVTLGAQVGIKVPGAKLLELDFTPGAFELLSTTDEWNKGEYSFTQMIGDVQYKNGQETIHGAELESKIGVAFAGIGGEIGHSQRIDRYGYSSDAMKFYKAPSFTSNGFGISRVGEKHQ